MSLRVMITGTTGMIGEGVLMECLANPQVAAVLSVSRKPTGMMDPKLKEFIVPDFLKLSDDEENLRGYDACFFCAGVSSIGMNESDYNRITYDTTIHFAKVLVDQDPQMTFIYVSGAATDSSEKGRLMWARVKGRTENALLNMPFKRVYNFRPGLVKLAPGQKNALTLYKYFAWLFPLLKVVLPNGTSTMQQVGRAMINSVLFGYEKNVLEVKDINKLGALQ